MHTNEKILSRSELEKVNGMLVMPEAYEHFTSNDLHTIIAKFQRTLDAFTNSKHEFDLSKPTFSKFYDEETKPIYTGKIDLYRDCFGNEYLFVLYGLTAKNKQKYYMKVAI
ncbi:hypothetical protein K6L09_21025 [Burkholderia cepacia]